MTKKPKSEIASEILAYLAENPDAEDTMEGIVEWWLLEQKIKRETEKVKKALSQLIERDLVLRRKGKNSRVYYRINKNKFGEVQSIIKDKSKVGK